MKLIDLKSGLFRYDGVVYLKTPYLSQTKLDSTDPINSWPWCFDIVTGRSLHMQMSVAEFNNIEVEPIQISDIQSLDCY